MQGQEAIVRRILSDAEEKAAGWKSDARARADEKRTRAREQADRELERGLAELSVQAKERVERRETVARLDCGKLLLKAKRNVLDRVFSRTLELAASLPAERYLRLIGELLDRYAEQGDGVVLAAAAPIGETDLLGLPVFRARSLTFCGKDGAFSGGILLKNDLCDKDLSFESLIDAQRSALESELSETLFSGESGRK